MNAKDIIETDFSDEPGMQGMEDVLAQQIEDIMLATVGGGGDKYIDLETDLENEDMYYIMTNASIGDLDPDEVINLATTNHTAGGKSDNIVVLFYKPVAEVMRRLKELKKKHGIV